MCWSFGGESGIWVKVTLSTLLRFFAGASFRLGLLTLKGNGNGMINVLVRHVLDGRHIIGWVSHRGKHSYYTPCVDC